MATPHAGTAPPRSTPTRRPASGPPRRASSCRSRRRSRPAPRSGCTASSSSPGAFRIFGRFGFGEGIAGHITVRDPEDPHMFWVNPFGMSFRHIRVSDLIAVNHEGQVVHGNKPVNQAGFVIHSAVHAAHPDVVAAAHAHSVYGKAWSSLAPPARPDHPGRLHALREPRRGHRGSRRRRARPRGRPGARRRADRSEDGVPPEPRHLLAWATPSPRPRGGSSTPSATARPSCSPRPPGTPTADRSREREVHRGADRRPPYAGWFSFQPLWDEIVRTDPDLFD